MHISTSLFLAEGQQVLDLVNVDVYTIGFTLANLLIMFFFYFKFAHQPVMAIMKKRNDKIAADIEDAKNAKARAEAAEKEYLEKISGAKEEAQAIVAAAKKRADSLADEVLTAARAEADEIKTKGYASVEQERKRAVNEIKNQISELVILAAQAVAEKEISENDNKNLIDSFLLKVGE